MSKRQRYQGGPLRASPPPPTPTASKIPYCQSSAGDDKLAHFLHAVIPEKSSHILQRLPLHQRPDPNRAPKRTLGGVDSSPPRTRLRRRPGWAVHGVETTVHDIFRLNVEHGAHVGRRCHGANYSLPHVTSSNQQQKRRRVDSSDGRWRRCVAIRPAAAVFRWCGIPTVLRLSYCSFQPDPRRVRQESPEFGRGIISGQAR